MFLGSKQFNKTEVFLMRKAILLLVLGGLLLIATGCGGNGSSSGSTGSTNTLTKSITVSTSVKNAIEKYFNAYFDAEKASTYSELDSSILEDNADTKLFETFRKMELARQQLFSEGISWYNYDITYKKSSTSGDETTVELTLDLKFHYNKAPDLDSAYGGVNYSFILRNNGSGLVIKKIDSDLDIFVAFKTEVEEVMAQDSTLSKVQAVEKVRKRRGENLDMMRGNSLYFKGAATSASTSTSTESTTDIETTTTGSQISKSVYITNKKYTYQPTCAVEYAAKYYDVEDTHNGIFGLAKNEAGMVVDCTNFVSQCVWAGYIGFKSTDIATAKNYISKTIGMVPSKWYWKDDKSFTSTWAGVKLFFGYMVTPKTVGPNATTDFSDYDTKHEYTTIAASSIHVGDVIQLWYDGTGYGHSIFITDKRNNTSNCKYSDLFYSAHTNKQSNMVLSYATGATGKNRYIRRLTPAATCYLKSE
jgi:hypothetical protein